MERVSNAFHQMTTRNENHTVRRSFQVPPTGHWKMWCDCGAASSSLLHPLMTRFDVQKMRLDCFLRRHKRDTFL